MNFMKFYDKTMTGPDFRDNEQNATKNWCFWTIKLMVFESFWCYLVIFLKEYWAKTC